MSWHAAHLLFAAGEGGLIVNVSSPGGRPTISLAPMVREGRTRPANSGYGHELKDKGIVALSYPGSVATEFIVANSDARWRPSHAQTPLGVGRTVAALALAEDLMN